MAELNEGRVAVVTGASQALSPSAAALDDNAAARLWEESEALVSRAGYAHG